MTMFSDPAPYEGFIGRREELKDLYRRASAAGSGAAESIVLAGERGAGKTALLQQLTAQLFWKQERIVPFLYPVTEALLGASDFASDYLASFLRQRFAFDDRDQALLSAAGMPLRELAALAGVRGAAWASELIERFLWTAEDPIIRLQTALSAPARSSRETGRPVLVMIDDFPVLGGLHRGGPAEPRLLSLFRGPLSVRTTPHVLAGVPAALRELPLTVLSGVALRPLSPADALQLFLSLLQPPMVPALVPRALVDHLNGNPLYIRRVAGAAAQGPAEGEEAFWSAYVSEVTGGGLAQYFAGSLKSLFPDPGGRRNALEVLHRIHTAGTDPAAGRAVRAFVAERLSPEAVVSLLRAGLVVGEFGEYRAPGDAVLHDFVVALYEREIAGRSAAEIRKLAVAGRGSAPASSWDLSIPLVPRAELVVAKSLEQVGRKLHASDDAIGQLQLAVIEACINAIEHTKGGGDRLAVSIRAVQDRLEVAVESPGQEFVPIETGEPLVESVDRDGALRGQGIKLMKRFTDAVRFERTPRGTRVVLVKNISRAAAATKEGASHRE